MTAVHSDPQILGGTPVFMGTRVPVSSLFDYLRRGYTVEYFLAQFPTVSREQVDDILTAVSEGRSWAPTRQAAR